MPRAGGWAACWVQVDARCLASVWPPPAPSLTSPHTSHHNHMWSPPPRRPPPPTTCPCCRHGWRLPDAAQHDCQHGRHPAQEPAVCCHRLAHAQRVQGQGRAHRARPGLPQEDSPAGRAQPVHRRRCVCLCATATAWDGDWARALAAESLHTHCHCRCPSAPTQATRAPWQRTAFTLSATACWCWAWPWALPTCDCSHAS